MKQKIKQEIGCIIPKQQSSTKALCQEMEDILRHFSEAGDANFRFLKLSEIKLPNNLSKKHPKKQINKLVKAFKKLGYSNPIIVTEQLVLISGYGRLLAAQELKMEKIPVIILNNITEAEADAIRLADNRIAEDSAWDLSVVGMEIEKLLNIGYELEEIGYEPMDYDKLLNNEKSDSTVHNEDKEDDSWLDKNIPPLVKSGDLYRLGDHFLFCGDALNENSYITVMQGETAQIVITDPPYNCKIKNFVCKTAHKEFEMASGEMTSEQFANFLLSAMKMLYKYSSDGSLHYLFIDWRGINILLNSGLNVYNELINILVWNKTVGGQGAFYRSQHELIPVFKKKGKHRNNIQLGKNGRYRTNVLDYPGIRATNPESLELLKLHPTVKSVPLIHDLLLDASLKNDIVLDCFGGSGSTLIAAERCKRRARLIEISPRYCDVIIYRWELETGKRAKFVKNFGGNENEQ